MSYFVYILRNLTTDRYYIGSTNNLERRIAEHNRGNNRSTRQKGVWQLIYFEEYSNRIDSQRRERQIKSYKSGNAFKQLVGQQNLRSLDMRE